MGYVPFTRWEVIRENPGFLPMLPWGAPPPWSQDQIESAYRDLMSLARASASRLAALNAPVSTIRMKSSTQVPPIQGGLFGRGARPGYTMEEPYAERLGGWRILRRCSFHDWSDCGPDWPRPRRDSYRCDEVWLTRDGQLTVATITENTHFGCPSFDGPTPLPWTVVDEGPAPATKEQLYTFDVRYHGSRHERAWGFGLHEEYRPYEGDPEIPWVPFTAVTDALQQGYVDKDASHWDIW